MGWVTAGVALQVLGAIITGSGLWRTWQTNKRAGERFFQWPPQWSRRWVLVCRPFRAVAAMFRLARAEDKDGVDAVTTAENASVIKRVGPPLGMSTGAQLQWLVEQHLRLSAKLEIDLRDVHNERERLQRTVEEYADTMREEARKAAYGGERRQAWGLLLVTVGVAIAAVPTYADKPASRVPPSSSESALAGAIRASATAARASSRRTISPGQSANQGREA
ncbi:hypothetical protein ABT373_20035 [Streptomyces sp. NPDC000070]|uniref:hypothetical protein n=1 Tax=Streptomyces sp. NPDC000070 TaxID=3154240 RepID=UPI003317B2AA